MNTPDPKSALSAEDVAYEVANEFMRDVIDIKCREGEGLIKIVQEALTAFSDAKVIEALQRKQDDKYNDKQMDYAVLKARNEALEEAIQIVRFYCQENIGTNGFSIAQAIREKIKALKSPGGSK